MGRKIQNLKKRHRQELHFKLFGMLSIGFALTFLVILFTMIVTKGHGAFLRTEISLEVDLSNETDIEKINYRQLVKDSLKQEFPDAKELGEINSLYQLVSKIANLELKKQIEKNSDLLGKKSDFWFSASSKSDMFFKHKNASALNEKQLFWLEKLEAEKALIKS